MKTFQVIFLDTCKIKPGQSLTAVLETTQVPVRIGVSVDQLWWAYRPSLRSLSIILVLCRLSSLLC